MMTLESLQASVMGLKELVEVLAGQRGQQGHHAVTWADLQQLGLAPAEVTPSPQPPPNIFSSEYMLSDLTTDPPGTGEVRLNNADQSSATSIYLSGFTADGTDVLNFWRLISTIDRVLLQTKGNSAQYQVYNASAPPLIVVNSYVEIPVIWSSGGADVPTGGRVIVAVN